MRTRSPVVILGPITRWKVTGWKLLESGVNESKFTDYNIMARTVHEAALTYNNTNGMGYSAEEVVSMASGSGTPSHVIPRN